MAAKRTEEGKLLEEYINFLIDKRLEEHETSIKQEDAKEIVEHIMPELEKVIARMILKHLRSIATYTLKELKEE